MYHFHKGSSPSSPSSRLKLPIVVLQRAAKKCTKIYNARTQLLVFSLNLLFSDVPVAVAIVVFVNFQNNKDERRFHIEAK